MEDLRHTGSSIMGFTILDAKNYESAKAKGDMSQVTHSEPKSMHFFQKTFQILLSLKDHKGASMLYDKQK